MDWQTPKKQRKDGAASLSPPGSTPSPAAAQGPQGTSGVPQWASGAPQEAGVSNAAAAGRSGATVTDAAKAFRELRVRAPRASSPRRDGGGHGSGPQRPPSPKKRKASSNIDKEFILKDDKVKRNTDTQGDISQARGQLGQLLFEFSQIELNRDLLEAIKRTESKTGRSSGRPPAPSSRLDRSAFEVAVADAAELLQAQLSSVEAHCEDASLRGAILRTYAVQAIAAFAEEDSDSEGSEGPRAGASGSSSDEENADSNSRRRMRGGSSSQDEPVVGPRGLPLQETGSQPPDMLPRSASAAGRHSPPRLPAQLQHPQQQTGRPPGAACASPQRSQHAGSTAGPAGSSSYLPDAPPDSALEDTATAGGPRQPRGRRREGSVPPGTAAACSRFGWPSLQQQQQGEQLQQGERGADDEPLQRMRMLSLEAEGSAQRGHSAEEGDEDGPQDMIRSPAPVTSRPTPPGLPLPPSAAGQLDAGGMVLQGQQRGRAGGGGGGARRGAAAAAGARMVAQLVFEEAAQLALGERPQEEHHQEREQEQESSEGHSAGQASSAAHEPPKRQRRSGDLLPPLLEHSSQHRQHRPHPQQHVAPASPGAAAGAATPAGDRETDPRAAAAAHRAAILGSLRPWERPGQLDGQQQHGEDPAPAGALEAGSDAAGNGGGAGHGVCPDRQLLLPQQRGPLDAEGQQPEGGAGGGPPGEVSNATLRAPRAAHSGSSVWGSTLVCADLTVNDVASQYWPFLRSAMRGQTATLQAVDKRLVAALVSALGETIFGKCLRHAYIAVAGSGRPPPAEVKSLVAATAFDDFFRARTGGTESSGASLG